MLTITSKGIDLIMKFEGLRLKAYRCPANVLTIGYGHTGADVTEGLEINHQEAENLLIFDLKKFDRAVRNYVKVNLKQCQFDALVSFVYNVGIGNFSRSMVLRRVNSNPNDPHIADEMRDWNTAGGKELAGLTKRRNAEIDMYFNN